MKKVLVVFGTRPEAIKMAPVVKALKGCDSFDVKVCITAQHREMLDRVLELFGIVADFDLDLMRPKQDLFDITRGVLQGMDEIVKKSTPDLVLVHGDTTTTFAAALAAFYHKVPVGHVEAGLRTGDRYSPWPEEINRVLTADIATYHFAPTVQAKANLIKENISDERIAVTGNTIIDALQMIVKKIESDEVLKMRIVRDLQNAFANRGAFDIEHTRFILVTAHRRENFGKKLENICAALKEIAKRNPDLHIVYPVHPNPNVRETTDRMLSESCEDNIHLIAPVSYESFVYLMKMAHFIVTDSGGIQEEAPGLGKPVLLVRDTTERPEAIEAGTVKLVGTAYESIVTSIQALLDDEGLYEQMSRAKNPYGDGTASLRIVDFLSGNLR